MDLQTPKCSSGIPITNCFPGPCQQVPPECPSGSADGPLIAPRDSWNCPQPPSKYHPRTASLKPRRNLPNSPCPVAQLRPPSSQCPGSDLLGSFSILTVISVPRLSRTVSYLFPSILSPLVIFSWGHGSQIWAPAPQYCPSLSDTWPLRAFCPSPPPEAASPLFSPYQSCQGLRPPLPMPSLRAPAQPSYIYLSHYALPHYQFPNPSLVALLDVTQVIVSCSELCALKGAAPAVIPYGLCASLSIFPSFSWLHPNFPHLVLCYFSFL